MDPTLMLVLGLVAIFLSVVLLLTTVGTITTERQAVNRSLAAVEAIQTAPKSMQSELDRPFGERVLGRKDPGSVVLDEVAAMSAHRLERRFAA